MKWFTVCVPALFPGPDYTINSSSVTFPADVFTQLLCISFSATANDGLEDTESVNLTLSTAQPRVVFTDNVATISISDPSSEFCECCRC